MTAFSYADTPYPVRADLAAAHRAFWEVLAGPGAWWSGVERVAIADEVRRARDCSLCRERKAALSPAMVDGSHDSGSALPLSAVDAIHRVVTDASRLSRSWVEKLQADGLSDAHYVELVGVVVAVVSVDSFHRGLGVPPEPLPVPRPGAPSGRRPASAVQESAWVPWIPSGKATGPEADLYPSSFQAPNVFKAMSLVPDAVRAMASLSRVQYIEPRLVALPGATAPGRAIDRTQMELIAGRVSALNECFY